MFSRRIYLDGFDWIANLLNYQCRLTPGRGNHFLIVLKSKENFPKSAVHSLQKRLEPLLPLLNGSIRRHLLHLAPYWKPGKPEALAFTTEHLLFASDFPMVVEQYANRPLPRGQALAAHLIFHPEEGAALLFKFSHLLFDGRGAELLRLFRQDFPDLRFHLEIHPQYLNAAIRKELAEAPHGQLHLEAGVQSLEDDVQKAIGRNSRAEEVLSGLRFLCSCPNFETHADLLAGLPGQTMDSLFRDVSLLIETGAAEIQLETLKVLPGTPLRSQAAEAGILFSPEAPYDVMRTGTMSAEDILLARKLSRLLDLTCNHPALHEVIRAVHREKEDFLPEFLSFFLSNGLDLKRIFDLKKRFLLVESYLSGRNWKLPREVLAYQWLRAGFPPEAGPGAAARKAERPPEDALLAEGDPASREERETRFLRLDCGDACFWFAFNRRYAINRPTGIWKTPRTGI